MLALRKAVLAALALALVPGCGPKKTASTAEGASLREGAPWSSKVDVNHPLVGRIWSARDGAFVDRAAMVEKLAAGRYVLLGERHDNLDHHRLQGAMVAALVVKGRKPSVAFEMIDLDRQDDLDAALASAPKDPDSIARGAEWHHSGWPPWATYRPIGEAALAAGLPIVAANYPRHAIKALFSPTPPALDHPTAARFAVEQPLPPGAQKSLEAELRASHCNELPEETIPKMVLAQRLRDGAMAERMVEGDKGDGAVLIAGVGHVRLDRGVPMVLRLKGSGKSIASLAFLEVQTGKTEPDAYAAPNFADALPFDFVWFTPRVDDGDPCAAKTGKTKGK